MAFHLFATKHSFQLTHVKFVEKIILYGTNRGFLIALLTAFNSVKYGLKFWLIKILQSECQSHFTKRKIMTQNLKRIMD